MMKLTSRMFVSAIASLFLAMMLSFPLSAVSEMQSGLGNGDVEADTTLLLAHHAGSRPDSAQDIDDRVHGGDPDNWPEDQNPDSGSDQDQGSGSDDNGGSDDDSDDDSDNGGGNQATS